VNVNVVVLNDRPVFVMNNISTTEAVTNMDANINKGTPYRPGLTVLDKDVREGSMRVDITISPQDGSRFTIDVTALGQKNVLSFDENKGITFTGKFLQINDALQTFTFYPKDDTLGKKYTVTFNVNDLGHTGQCGDPLSATLTYTGKPCELESLLVVNVVSVDQQLINGTAIAAGGLAAIGLTVLAVLGAMRLFNKEAMDGSYAPWNSFEADGASLDNPLYEAGAIEGTSAIYNSREYVELDKVNGSGQTWL